MRGQVSFSQCDPMQTNTKLRHRLHGMGIAFFMNALAIGFSFTLGSDSTLPLIMICNVLAGAILLMEYKL